MPIFCFFYPILKNSSENQEDSSKIENNDGQIYSSNLKKLSISLAKFSPKFCDKCDKYFCSERALQKHIDFAHLIENILLNDNTDIHKNGSEIFVEKSNNIESAQIAQKVICKICKKQFISAKDIMEHSVLEHSVETTQFTKDFILLPNNKENVKIKNIEIIKSERNQLDIHSIKCHICKEKVPVKDYASHCKEIHRINCVIKKLEKNNIDMSKVPKLCYDGSKWKCEFVKLSLISFFYTLRKNSRLKSTFLPNRVKKQHSTLEMDTLKVMLLLSYLASLDNKPHTWL